jgi:subtilase family serine protease
VRSFANLITGLQRFFGLGRKACGSPAKARKSTVLNLEELESRILRSGLAQPASTWLTPAEVRAVYGFNSVPAFTANGKTYAANGQGQTIAILDVGGNANVATDLQTFSTQFHLPQMDGKNGDPTFKQVNENGGDILPAPGSGAFEIDLDVEWAHAIAPDANIVLVEVNSFAGADIEAGLQTADSSGASVVSISLLLKHDLELAPPPGVTYVSCAGDAYGNELGTAFGASGVGSYDLTVGGTEFSENGAQLTQNKDAYPGEQVWDQYAIDNSMWTVDGTSYDAGTTWGTYGNVPLPLWQASAAFAVGSQTGTTPTTRLSPDVSMVASNLAVVDSTDFGSSTPWGSGWGTSFATPMWAGLIAIANEGRALELPGRGPLNGTDPVLPMLYSLPSSDFNHVTTDPNSVYDQATGLGTPKANLIIPALVAPFNGSGQLTIDGSSSGADSISVSVVYEQNAFVMVPYVQVQDNNQTELWSAGQVKSIVVNASPSDTVTINATPAGVPVTINLGSGTDSVVINGLGGGLPNSGLGGTATVNGGTGQDTLTVNDQTAVSASATAYYVTDWSIQRNTGNAVNFKGLSQVTVNGMSPTAAGTSVYYYVGSTLSGSAPALRSQPGAATLSVDGSGTTGNNYFTIGGTNNYFGAKQALNISTGQDGVNSVTVNMLPKGVALNIDSSATQDNVYIGQGSEYSLTGIQGAINISNTSGQTNVLVDGSGDPSANYTLTNSTLRVSNGPTITYESQSLDGSPVGVTSLEVIEGGAQDIFNAESVAALTSVYLHNDQTSKPVVRGPAAGSVIVE